MDLAVVCASWVYFCDETEKNPPIINARYFNNLPNRWCICLWFVCINVSVYTSFGVSDTWVSPMFVGGFAISVDPPWLAECLRNRLNQTRSGQEIVTLVTIVVTTETTSLPCPSWSQLRRWTESSAVFTCINPKLYSHLYPFNNFFTFKSTRPRPSQSRRRSSPNFTCTDDCTDLWMCRWPVQLHR